MFPVSYGPEKNVHVSIGSKKITELFYLADILPVRLCRGDCSIFAYNVNNYYAKSNYINYKIM